MADFSQIERFAQRLDQAGDIQELEREWINEWAPKLAADMKQRAPRRTGTLAESIQPTDQGVEVGVDYGVYVARGTSHMAPQPFDVQAIQSTLPRAADGAAKLAIDKLRL